MFLYHGSNSYYLKNIIKKGLDGSYPKKDLKLIIKIWKEIYQYFHQFPKSILMNKFIDKHVNRIEKNIIINSFSKDFNIAKHYAFNKRLGEGVNIFYKCLKIFNKFNPKYKKIKKYFSNMYHHLPIILAIKNKDNHLNTFEIEIKEKININQLFIVKLNLPNYNLFNDNNIVPLLSIEGQKYIKQIFNINSLRLNL